MPFQKLNRIEFKSPDLDTLAPQFTVVDMHFHSLHSDGHDAVAEIAAQARALGIGIAITDHNEIRGAMELAGHTEILTIPGIEITSAEGSHLLVYFYSHRDLEHFYLRAVLPFMGADVMSSTSREMEALIEAARQYPALVILPHPYSTAYTGVHNSYFTDTRLQNIYDMVDGIEVINAENMNKWNLKSTVLGFNLAKGVTGGSDGHRLMQMGKSVTLADCAPVRGAFLDALKAGMTKVVGKEIHLLRKVTSNTRKLRSNMRNYPDLLEKNIRYSYAFFNAKRQSLQHSVMRSLNGRKHKNG
ncbi:MAG: PHP domain-containing protein [Desulfosarcina sp.]|nr:PHP domain-containing protein [Desulfobacterales bacterium]